MNEAYYNDMLKKAIRRQGIYVIKTSDRATAGVPDIYAAGGNWIEGKLIPMPTRRSISILAHIDPAQKIIMNNLVKCGDECWVAVYLCNTYGIQYFLFVPWEYMRAVIIWRHNDIHHFGIPVNNQNAVDRLQIDRFFNKDWPGNSGTAWFEAKWKEWTPLNAGQYEFPTKVEVGNE